ncbi:MAG: hypothetical protein H0T15_03385 [Thermoleophilaceae bacterium]|nr:hypothetical protein [Thermoleophilaceae bacterium]
MQTRPPARVPVVVILGFGYGDGEAIFGLVPINTEDNAFHVLLALAGFGAFAATPVEPVPTTV